MKIAIIGSRNFIHCGSVLEVLSKLSKNDIVISGGASGIDSYAIEKAKEAGFETKEYKPDMSGGYDVAQYHIRNDKIIDEADKVIAFWDGASAGTKSVIQKCLERRKNIEVIFD